MKKKDNIKKIATKTAVGVGIIGASFGNLEAQEIKTDINEKKIIKLRFLLIPQIQKNEEEINLSKKANET